MSKIDTYRSIGSFDFRLESDFPLSSASPGHFSIYFLVISLVFSFFLELTASIFSFLCLSFLRPRIVRRAENVQKSAEWTGWMGFWVRIGRATSPQKIRPETREMTHQFRFFFLAKSEQLGLKRAPLFSSIKFEISEESFVFRRDLTKERKFLSKELISYSFSLIFLSLLSISFFFLALSSLIENDRIAYADFAKISIKVEFLYDSYII